jgi:1-phosphofructokinase
MPPKIATITLNPAIDQTASIPNFAAGEVNRVEWEQSDPGGKGVNVASFLTDFGYSVAVSGFLGMDNAAIFQQFFAQKQINDRFIRIPGKTRINIKIVDDAQQQVTDVNFPGQTATASEVGKLIQTVDELAIDCDWFVLSGSIPAGISPGIYAELILRLKAKGKKVVLDASGESLRQAVAAAPAIIKPNIGELQELLGQQLATEAAIVQAAQRLLEQGIHCVAVSRGAEGAIFVEPQETVLARPPKVEVKSTVGAGDAMVSGLVTGKLRGLPLSDCARLATAFSIGALSQLGPRLPPQEAIEAFMAQVTVQPLNSGNPSR